ncbi:hypothetical protein L484_015035 [Morus notabilis]|uniref:Uncharacterized protein n=1 Tax=Morus notabilis TaxID=981085 RepID=W9S784_9ROSA|nr:hypothetical protein L484_015035 [Morus notabilis]
MAVPFSLSLHTPLLPFRPRFVFPPKTGAFFPILPIVNLRISVPVLVRSSLNAVPGTEQEVLRAVADSNENSLPCVRTYENDLARLTLVGAVDFQQALTAGGGGRGRGCGAGPGPTVARPPTSISNRECPPWSWRPFFRALRTSTFLPARKVKEKAGKLRLREDIFSGATSKNILAMTFRQVVLQQLWSFELVVFRPGTERNMEDLENPREVSASFTLSSSDERVISVLAEAVCISALQSTERSFLDNYLGKSSSSLFCWLQKPRRIVSKDSSVIITKLFEDEIVENAKSLLVEFNSTKAHFRPSRNRSNYHWWTPTAHSKLEKIGGPQFSAWTSEYIPAYMIQIDANQLKDVKLEGWRKSSDNMWEVLFTHSQMECSIGSLELSLILKLNGNVYDGEVGLADVIDMYYEDLYTLPNKELSCGFVRNFTNLPNKKRNSVLLKMLSITVASGIFIIAISALGQLCLPHLKVGNYIRESQSLSSSEVESLLHQSLDDAELEAFCISVVKRIKDALGWPGDITGERSVGVWTGILPEYLRLVVQNDSDSEGISTTTPAESIDAEIKTSAQDIANYQVVLSLDGKLVGFQPTSRVAVNQWAGNPLAKELYGGRNLSPGLIEPGLNVHRPDGGIVVIELLMSTKPDACFALARPKLVGFQPTSRVAVNQWAGNPLAKELYGGRNLSPGLIEPGLNVHRPDGGIVVIELLMSTKPDACFALARPSR